MLEQNLTQEVRFARSSSLAGLRPSPTRRARRELDSPGLDLGGQVREVKLPSGHPDLIREVLTDRLPLLTWPHEDEFVLAETPTIADRLRGRERHSTLRAAPVTQQAQAEPVLLQSGTCRAAMPITVAMQRYPSGVICTFW